jgi:hypothetical protein
MSNRSIVLYDDWSPLYEPYDWHHPSDAVVDSQIDFDDETGDDQLPLDEVEAIEAGVDLDDPEVLDPDE